LNRDPATGKEYRTNKGKHGWKGLRCSDAEHEARRAEAEKFAAALKSKKGGKP
jgi:hypothetical protein